MKKKSNIFEPFSPKIVLTNIFMSACVIIIVLILILIAQGYSLGEGGGIERSGLLELSTHPGSTDIKVDGKSQFFQGNFSKIFSSGMHDISVSKKSYDTWQGQAQIESGLVTSIDWVRLFPDKKQFDLIADLAPARFATVSPNHRYLLYLPENSTDLMVFNLQSDPKKPSTFNLAQLLSSSELNSDEDIANLSPIDGSISVSSWNNNSDILSIKWQSGETAAWAVVNLSNPSDSINLTRQFHLELSDLRILNDSATKLWALSHGELRILDTTKNTVPEPIVTSVHSFTSSESTSLFIKEILKDNQTQYNLYLYKENAKQPSKIKSLDNNSSLYTLGRYWGKDWLAYTNTSKLYFLSGNFSSESSIKKARKSSVFYQLAFSPKDISASHNQRILFLHDEKDALSLDINSSTVSSAHFSHNPSAWLDNYLRYNIGQGALHVSDFDGKNTRVILPNSYKLLSNLPATIHSGSSYLYFFAQPDSQAAQELLSKDQKDEDKDTATQAVQLYRLHL